MAYAYHHVGKHFVCGMDEAKKIGSEDSFAGSFMKNTTSPQFNGFGQIYMVNGQDNCMRGH
eukprot:8925952-Ditylum_brightwellii.AAC.1